MRVIVIAGQRIINVADPFPMNNPIPGLQEDGTYVLYVEDLDGLKPIDFMRQRYWNGTELVPRPAPPSDYFIWDGVEWKLNINGLLKVIRQQRNSLLYKTDWTQLPDAPLTSEQVAESVTYRQALRDITMTNFDNYISPDDVVWPTPPSFLNVS